MTTHPHFAQTSLQHAIVERVQACLKQAEHKLNKRFAMPVVKFNQRGRTAGSARLQLWELRFNPVLLAENPQAFLDDVVPHELAHLIVYQLFGRVKPHGREWQAVMEGVFKRPAKTTHSFSIANVQGTTYRYRCACQEHQLTVRRHNKIQRGQTSYRCKGCGQTLQLSP
uniref:SprT family zinc-dependent metalloprotease n=1 Tax=Thaumasiovibrio occultus TaxID=1891184 RepID=UPI000B35B55D|nr:SprT family zinc-dependent metalloprotease [Thaumasiovibrio occultus]